MPSGHVISSRTKQISRSKGEALKDVALTNLASFGIRKERKIRDSSYREVLNIDFVIWYSGNFSCQIPVFCGKFP